VPIKATVGYLLSVGAAFGASQLVFNRGWLSQIVNLDRAGPIISFMPILLMGIFPRGANAEDAYRKQNEATNALIALSLGLMAPAAFADDYPPRKAGLWQMTTKSSTGGAPEVVHQCIDAASDKAMQQAGKAMAQQIVPTITCTSSIDVGGSSGGHTLPDGATSAEP